MAKGGSVRVESYTNMSRVLLAEHLLQRIAEAKDGGCVLTLAVYAWRTDKSVVGTVNQCVGIEEKNTVHRAVFLTKFSDY